MPCPKCGSKSTSLTLNSTNPWDPYPNGVEYSCYMCGLRLYGQKAVDKVEEWRAMAPTREQLLSQLREQEAQRLARARLREALLKGELAGIRVQEAPEKVQAPPDKPQAPGKKLASPEKQEKAKQRKREIEALRRKRLREGRAQEQAASAPKLEDGVLQVANPDDQKCSWSGCEEPRKGGSKYCSKKCSNKFAHARERERKLLAKKS